MPLLIFVGIILLPSIIAAAVLVPYIYWKKRKGTK